MREKCAPRIPAHENAGARLGAIISTLALGGRDKLTLVASPSISSFGLWVEQLIAESTGKEGKGIIPVTGEPLVEPAHYEDDRQFVCLRLEGDNNSAIDTFIEQIKASGQPVVRLELRDGYDLGAEFFRWEFAIAVAGAILGIHPFNQPGVQQAKDLTKHVLQEYRTSGRLPQVTTVNSPNELLAEAKRGDYLAIMAYIRQTSEVDQALADLQQRVMEQHRIATTLGYGPRYLHSTGQLHKDGPGTGLYLQVTADHKKDLPIPGESYTFGVLADAQAVGDLQTLQSLGRRAIRIHLGRGDRAAIRRLTSTLA
jgi:glucose-6-phosphate isomerase/transaldolase/glucose-6-phosphate isomerase